MFRKLMIVAAAGLFIAGAMASAKADAITDGKKYTLNGSAWISINGQPHRVDVRASNITNVDDARIWILNSRLQVCGQGSKVVGARADNGKLVFGIEGWWMGQPVVYRMEVTADRTLMNPFKLEANQVVFHNGRPLSGFLYLFLY